MLRRMDDLPAKQPRLPLGERLVAHGLITENQLARALKFQKENHVFLGQALVHLGFLPMATIGRHLEETSGFPYVDLSSTKIDREAAQLLPESTAREKNALVFAATGSTARVAMIDPLDIPLVDGLSGILGRRIFPYIVFEADLMDAMGRVYDGGNKTQNVLDDLAQSVMDDPAEPSVDSLIVMAEDAPIVRLVHSLIQSAISVSASDLHIEPQENLVRVRFRQDGLLCDQATIPVQHLAAVVSRIKIMAHMNIAERRRPQDGRIAYRTAKGAAYDLRVSSMPLIFGEKIVMRILAKNSAFADSASLGFFPKQQEMFERFLKHSHGILLVTGPTGSGKSTTLFAALNQINGASRNINTVEDPVEYTVVGVNQMQVNPQIGVTFATGLRSMLRQDPDVIMVGEIRDNETAVMAVQAALTGHLVLSTIHTNSAVGALTRLMNMGIEPYVISASIFGAIGQRLVRNLCLYCQELRPPDRTLLAELGVSADAIPAKLPIGKGCDKCRGTGMKGRTAVYELLPITDTIRSMLKRGAAEEEIQVQAVEEGMMTMRSAGTSKVLQGVVAPEEILRVLFSEDI